MGPRVQFYSPCYEILEIHCVCVLGARGDVYTCSVPECLGKPALELAGSDCRCEMSCAMRKTRLRCEQKNGSQASGGRRREDSWHVAAQYN